MTMSALTHIPRRQFHILSQEALKLFNVSKAEVEKAITLGLKLLPISGTLNGSANSIETSLGFRVDSLKKNDFGRGKWLICALFLLLEVVPYFFCVPAKVNSRLSVYVLTDFSR